MQKAHCTCTYTSRLGTGKQYTVYTWAGNLCLVEQALCTLYSTWAGFLHMLCRPPVPGNQAICTWVSWLTVFAWAVRTWLARLATCTLMLCLLVPDKDGNLYLVGLATFI
jgi:hypothetical protein